MHQQARPQAESYTSAKVAPAHYDVLQRKCDCGNHTPAGANCGDCDKKKADLLQRAAADQEPVNTVPPIVHEVLRSPGHPLDFGTRAFMEPRFGHDFSNVRVHTGPRASASAQAVNALAYTVGHDVVFGDGHYAPETREGKSLLAHELTHVAQNSATVTNQPAPILIGPEGDRFEAEADGRANAVAHGELTASSATAVTPAGEPGRLSRAKFKVGTVEVNIDYGDVYKSLTGSFESVIKTRFTTWTGSPASTIHNELTALSNLAKEWVIFALDLLVDNPVTGLDKVQAVQRLIKYAPGAQYQHGSDKAPTFNFANEALSVSGWFEKALTSGLGALSSVRQSFVQQRVNPASASSSTSSSASSACPNPRSDKLDKAKLESDLPGQLEAYLKTVVVPTNVKTQAMSPLLKIADAIQERARTYYAPYADHSRGEGNTLVQQWQYSSHLVSSQSPAATPNPEMRHDYIDSRAKKVGGGGLFSQVKYDQRCADDANVLEGIVQKMQQQSNILALVDPILRQKSLTTPDSPRQVVLNLDVDKKTSDCDARWNAIRTLCHELMHVMEHDGFRAAIKGRQILREGFPEVLGHYLYEHIRGDASMKARMEDGLSSAPCSSAPSSTIGYDPDGPKAEEIRIAVGNDRFRAAFFLGQLSLAGIQPKRIDEANSNNPQEREADEAAQAVTESRSLQSPISPAPFAAASRHFATGSGAELEPVLRREMEGRLGQDFSRVRVHTDSSAAESARAIRSLAYTAGNDIVFGANQYAPNTQSGRKLLAHELTHVAQQTGGASSVAAQGKLQVDAPESVHERVAETVAEPVGMRSSGRPVDAATRPLTEPRFGQDFSRVRAHTDQQPARNILMRSPMKPGDHSPLPYREAMEATERALYEQYVGDCNGVRVLSRLEREAPISSSERVRRLEDRLKFIPIYFRFKQSHSHKEPSANDLIDKAVYQCVKECIFGKDYALTSEESELAITRCQISETRWQTVARAHHGHIPGGERRLDSDKAPWVPDPRVCFNPDRMEELKQLILSGRGCGGEVREERRLTL